AWGAVRRRSYYGILAYAFCVPILVFSYRQNLLDEFLLDALTTTVVFYAWKRLERRTAGKAMSSDRLDTVWRAAARGWHAKAGAQTR
ncbi:MAG: hypothetical protein ACRDJ3_03385, partial [Solirubrobacteraceae bacterium]